MEKGRVDSGAADRVIHIGAPKCGSTALQATFFRNRDALRAEGVVYVSRGAHWTSAAKAAVGAQDRISGKVPAKSEWQKLVAEVALTSGVTPSGVTSLISSEWFASASDERVRMITEDLDPARLHAVLVVRPLVSTLPSAWQQGLKLGGRLSLTEWLRLIIEQEDDPRAQRVWSKHRYDEIARRWVSVLGPNRVTVIAANEEDPSFIFSSFGHLLGLRDGTLSMPPKRTNPSLSSFESDALAELNRIYFERGGTLHEYRAGVLRTFDGYVNSLRSGPVQRSSIPQEHLEAVQRLSKDVAERIRETGCTIVGDLDRLASATTRAGVDAQDAPGAPAFQRETDVRSAAGMIYALMVTTGVANPSAQLPGFGSGATRLRHQTSSLIRRIIQTLRGRLKRRLP